MSAAAPNTDRTEARPELKLPDKSDLTPPDESLWQRYSPHGEAPLSGLGAFLLHALVAYGILDWDKPRRDPPVEAVRLLKPGGGGGGKDGGGAPGDGHKGEAGETPGGGEKIDTGEAPKLELSQIKAAEAALPEELRKDPAVGRRIKDGDASLARYTQMDQDARARLDAGVRTGATGPGEGVKKGDGGTGKVGMGEPGPGDGSGTNLTEREKRQFRWAMHFPPNTTVVDYLKELVGLGAILVVPVGRDRNHRSYKVVRKLLETPARLEDEDISKLQLLPFYEQNPRTAMMVAAHLKLQMPPGESYHVLYSRELEKRMAQMEEDAWKADPRSKGSNNTDDIAQTVFEVFPSGGRWDVRIEKIVPR